MQEIGIRQFRVQRTDRIFFVAGNKHFCHLDDGICLLGQAFLRKNVTQRPDAGKNFLNDGLISKTDDWPASLPILSNFNYRIMPLLKKEKWRHYSTAGSSIWQKAAPEGVIPTSLERLLIEAAQTKRVPYSCPIKKL
jgi:hypothetical protein